MNVLVTGGLGFIGSHTVVELLEAGHTPIIIDNLVNSQKTVLHNLEKLTGSELICYIFDIRETDRLIEIMKKHNVDTVIHFAALKAVGESVEKPLEYYQNNIGGLLSVLEAMKTAAVSKLVFSSSCTVYGDPDKVPITEATELKRTTNPYGETKQMAERIITDVTQSENIKAVNLRYFNPIGAHESALIGELPIGRPNCLVPYLTQATAGLRPPLTVYGNDYDTSDGSGVRDYIHVVDLAFAHVKAIDYLKEQVENVSFFNIGTGRGVSVLELIDTFEKVNGVKVPYNIGPRRKGDVACVFADPTKAEKELGWKAEKSLKDALKDAWRWQQTLTD